MKQWSFFNVYIKYNYGATAIANLTLDIEEGAVLSICGDVGSGKSTLLSAMAGLIPFSRGSALYKDLDCNSLNIKDKDLIYVPERDTLFLNRSVEYNLTYPLKKRKVSEGETEDRLLNALGVFGLTQKRKTPCRKLSRFDKVKVACARLVMRDAGTLLIDDLYKGLSDTETEELFELLQLVIKNCAKTVVIATESIDVAKRFTNNVLYLKYGQTMGCGDISKADWCITLSGALAYGCQEIYHGLLEEKDSQVFFVSPQKTVPLDRQLLLDDVFLGSEAVFVPSLGVVFDNVSERKIYPFPREK